MRAWALGHMFHCLMEGAQMPVCTVFGDNAFFLLSLPWTYRPPIIIDPPRCRFSGRQPARLTPQSGSSGSQFVMARCDTSLSADVTGGTSNGGALFGLPPPTGFVNSGGILADSVLTSQTAASVRAVFAPKLVAAVSMQRDAAGFPLHQLLLYSSISCLFGSPGQANYAAANAALEGWGAAASVQGQNCMAIQWGAWETGRASIGMFYC
jgi:hypothetical protein